MELGYHLSPEQGKKKKDHRKSGDSHGCELKLGALHRACCPTKQTGIPAPRLKAAVSFRQGNTEDRFQKPPELIRKQALKKQIKIIQLNLAR